MGEEVFRLVQQCAMDVCCPMCERSNLDVQLRCDLSRGNCIVAARCDRCRTSFRVEPGSWLLAQQRSSDVVLSCDAKTRSCSFQVAS